MVKCARGAQYLLLRYVNGRMKSYMMTLNDHGRFISEFSTGLILRELKRKLHHCWTKIQRSELISAATL